MTPVGEIPRPVGQPPDRVITLRVMAFPRGEYWYAECLDLNLMTRRSDLNSVLRSLREQIQLYLECAAESDDFGRRVPRRAPFKDWVIYYTASFIGALRRLLHVRSTGVTLKYPFDLKGHLLGA